MVKESLLLRPSTARQTSKITHMKTYIFRAGQIAVSLENNYPLYGRRFGVRILSIGNGFGLHVGPVLFHLHTNYAPLYGQGVQSRFGFISQ